MPSLVATGSYPPAIRFCCDTSATESKTGRGAVRNVCANRGRECTVLGQWASDLAWPAGKDSVLVRHTA